MGKKTSDEQRMIGVLPSEGADPIPTTESAPLSSIQVEPKAGADPISTTESAPLSSIQVEPKANADPIPVGKIPDGGTQVVKGDYAVNETKILHTVTTGKTLYLSAVIASANNTAEAAGTCQFFVRNASDETQYYFASFVTLGDTSESVGLSLCPPLEIAAGWDVCMVSGIALLYAWLFIHGYEV